MKKITTLIAMMLIAVSIGVNAQTNLLQGLWDGNGITGTGSKPNEVGWLNTVTASIPWNGANQSGGCRFRDYNVTGGYTGFTNETGGTTMTTRQLMLRFDNSAYSTSVYAYPVTLEACTSYTFAWDYVNGGSGGPGLTMTVGISTTANSTGRLSSKKFTSTSSAVIYRHGTYDFTTGPTAGTYYVTINGDAAWFGINNLSIVKNTAQSLNASSSSLVFGPSTLTKTFTVTGNALTADAALTAPSGISLDKTSIPAADAQCGVTVTATFDNATAISNDTIRITSGTLTQKIAVSSSVSSASCFTPLYSDRTNQVPDAYCSDLSGFGGWGNKSIVYGAESYCGNSSIKFTGTTNTYPNGAALDKSSYVWLANSAYRVRFKVKTVDGTLGFMANGANPNFSFSIPQTTDQWATVDTIFTTGAAPTTGFFSINNVDASATGKIAYIDNYELYDITNIDARLKSLTLDAGSLSPAFAPSITTYSVALPSGTTSVTPTATADVAAAAITGNGTVDVTTGSGTSTIQVTATDGVTTKTYKINYLVGVPTSVEAPSQKLFVAVAGDLVKVQGTSVGDDVKVYTVNGQLIKSLVASSDVTSLNLKSGVYVIKVNDTILKVVK